MAPKIIAFAGSIRKDSFNKKLVRIAADGAKLAGAEVTILDLKDLALPMYDQDEESERGLPDAAKKLKQLFNAHDGFLISSPDYNSSITGVLKNAIDWASRKDGNEAALASFTGKVAALMSASPGALGGLRGLVHLRAILGNIGVIVLPDQVAVAKAHDAFAENGALKDAKQHASVESLGKALANTLAKLKT